MSHSSSATQQEAATRARRTLSLVIPFVVGLSARYQTLDSNPNQNQIRDSFQFPGGELESLFNDLLRKSRPLPVSIEAIPRVVVTEDGTECAICLDGYQVGVEEARELPCNHRFHSGCIQTWLGIKWSCPVCRSAMPVEEEEDDNNAC